MRFFSAAIGFGLILATLIAFPGQAEAQEAGTFTNAELQADCNGGNAAACDILGMRYLRGDGTEKDLKKAAALFERACDRGDAEGCYNLAESYRFGDGVAKSVTKAVNFYQRGCDGDDGAACAQLAILYGGGEVKKDEGKAALYADRACTLESSIGCAVLGLVYMQGVDGYPKDTQRAEKLLTDACFKGAKFWEKPDIASRIGCPVLTKLTGEPSCFTQRLDATDVSNEEIRRHCYDAKAGWVTTVERGAPVAAAPARAPASAPPNPAAAAIVSFNAGVDAYENKDFARAAQLYGQACDGGIAKGCFNLGNSYYNGEGVAQNKARAAQLYGQACDGGDAGGCFNLGLLYSKGEGVAFNGDQAIVFWRKALRINPNDSGARQKLAERGLAP